MATPAGRDEFEIAIICALPMERDAVEDILDFNYKKKGRQYGRAVGDHNAYVTGSLGGKPVVLLCLRNMGNSDAVAAATSLTRSYTSIRIALLVGIAGAAPQTPSGQSIRLGDVIISTAVIQYDFGRQYSDSFKRKKEVEDTLGRTGHEIGSFLNKLNSKSIIKSMRAEINSKVQEMPMREDILHHADFRHKHRMPTVCAVCDDCHIWSHPVCAAAQEMSCDELGCRQYSPEQPPVDRREDRTSPSVQVHFGRIASGNSVIKSAFHRDKLITAEKVIAFEMEGAGLWDYLPTIIVKAACDYADSHKDKNWQEYAATTAAACAKAIVEEWELTDRPPHAGLSTDARLAQELSNTDVVVLESTRLMGAPLTHSSFANGLPEEKIAEAYEDSVGCQQRIHNGTFSTLSLVTVKTIIREVDSVLADKGQLRSLRRLGDFLRALDNLAEAMRPICESQSQLEMIWTPVANSLQACVAHVPALEALINAYVSLASALPGPETLHAMAQTSEIYLFLATIYGCLLEFHDYTSKIFAMRNWTRYFASRWGRSIFRLKHIVTTLKRIDTILRGPTPGAALPTFQTDYRQSCADLTEREGTQSLKELKAVKVWLDAEQYRQSELLDILCGQHCPGTTDWLFNDDTMQAWLSPGSETTMLSLVGKPGSGKSMLCAQLIRKLQADVDKATVYYLCSLRSSGIHRFEDILRSIVAGVAEQDDICAAYVYSEYVIDKPKPKEPLLKKLLSQLPPVKKGLRIVVDGIDECQGRDQAELLRYLRTLSAKDNDGYCVKAIVFTQDVPAIQSQLKNHTALYLHQQSSLTDAIGVYIKHELSSIKYEIEKMDGSGERMIRLERDIVAHADGMFLWVKLALASLKGEYRPDKLREAVENLPAGIDAAYAHLLKRIYETPDDETRRHIKQLFSMLLVAERPLKVYEVLDAVILCDYNHIAMDKQVGEVLLDKCKPMIEISKAGVVSMVHFTAKIFLMHDSSGPWLTQQQALHHAALACMSYMECSIYLADERVPESRCIDRVVTNLHCFHNFANAHWYNYLDRFTRCDQALEADSDCTLRSISTRFCTKYLALCSFSIPQTAPAIATSLSSFFESQSNVSQVLHTIHQAELQRASRSHSNTATQDRTSMHLEIQTPVEVWLRACLRYQAMVRKLLDPNCESVYPWHAHKLPLFRSQHAASQYVCKHNSCIRHSEGYETQEALSAHEKAHDPRFLCPHIDCHIGREYGFSSRHQLDKHIQTEHVNPITRLSTVRRGAEVDDLHNVAPSIPAAHTDASSAASVITTARAVNTNEHYSDYLRRLGAIESEALARTDLVAPELAWTPAECMDFYRYLQYFGTDFESMSQHMRTKSSRTLLEFYHALVRAGVFTVPLIAAHADANRASLDLRPPPEPL